MACLRQLKAAASLKFSNAPITVSALKEDIDARGLAGQISAKIDVVGYTDFVNLAVTHASQMNW
jgi:tRNA 2-thiouridine synthesizing protein B